MWPNPQETVDFVTFTVEILNGKLDFLCSDMMYILMFHTALLKCFICNRVNIRLPMVQQILSRLPRTSQGSNGSIFQIKGGVLVFWNI